MAYSGLQGLFGPFKPNIPVEVPIWLAVALQKRNNCRILQPEWLNIEALQGAHNINSDRYCRYCKKE